MARYINLQKLGSGGFGEVHSCRREEDGLIFAKKTLSSADEESQNRFIREVRMLSKLDHPSIVKVIGGHLSELPFWYVMPLYKRSLSQEFPGIVGNEERIRKVFGAILEGMQYVHEQGIVHRDLKPGNILLNSDDEVVISDFGLGLPLDSLSTRVTLTGDAFGTPGYVAPEQAADAKQADMRSDVFTLGRILYELYTGENPSAIQDLVQLPPSIASIIERCTRADPARRFQDGGKLRAAFTSLWAATDKQDYEGNARMLLANAIAEGSLSKSHLKEFADCLERLRDEADLMHEICVKLPESVIFDLWNLNPHLIRHIVTGFARQVASQKWGFDYVDTLGNACKKLCQAINDPQIRGQIAYAIVEVSVSHNRWQVMSQASDILLNYTSLAEDLAIAEAVEPIKHRLRDLGDRIDKRKLGPYLAALFNSE
jgi:eukaryotic-like serine/threonine-protein kinase